MTTIALKKPTVTPKPPNHPGPNPKIPTSDAWSPGRASVCPSHGAFAGLFSKNNNSWGQPRGGGRAQLKLANPLMYLIFFVYGFG